MNIAMFIPEIFRVNKFKLTETLYASLNEQFALITWTDQRNHFTDY